jgi:hypothetical protein
VRERGQGQANYLPFLINFTLINAQTRAALRYIIILIVTQGSDFVIPPDPEQKNTQKFSVKFIYTHT